MRIHYGLAQLIVDQIINLLGANVSVADDSGVIIASGDRKRVGSFDPVAGRTLQSGEPVEVERTRSNRRREGISLPLNYDGQRVGAIIVNDSLERCRSSARVVQALAELLIHQATVIEQLPLQKELRDKFIYDLLHNPSMTLADEMVVLRQGQVLGMDLSVPRVVILVDASRSIQEGLQTQPPLSALERELHIRRCRHRITQAVVNFFNLPVDTICGYIGDGRVAVLKAVDGENPPSWGDLAAFKATAQSLMQTLKQQTGFQINMGVGRYYPGVSGLAKSYRDASAALYLGDRLVGTDRVHCLDNLGIPALIGPADQQTKLELAIHLLSPLGEAPELVQTLQTFLQCDCSPSRAAEKLFVHRNTLGYRLDKISALTGLDPRRFDDAVQLRLALIFHDLAQQEEAA